MKNKRDKVKLWLVRGFCILLSALMISSIMYYSIMFLFNA